MDRAAADEYSAQGDPGMFRRVEAGKREAAAAEAQFKAAQQRSAAADQKRDTIGRLFQSVRNWVEDLGGISVVDVDRPEFRKAPVDFPAEIEARRRRLRELEADKRRAEVAPWSQSESRAEMRRQVLELAAGPDLTALIDGRGGRIRFPGKLGTGPFSEPADGGLRFALWLLHDIAVEKIDKIIDGWSLPGDALTENERRQKLEQIAGDMVSVQREECALIELAAERGLQIAHRDDVDVQAYLSVRTGGLKS